MNSGNQSRALVGTGLAYGAGVAVLLTKASAHTSAVLLLGAPLPLFGLVFLLISGISNIQQRARYLLAVEETLEPYTSVDHSLAVPSGFRGSEQMPRRSDWLPDPMRKEAGTGWLRHVVTTVVSGTPHTAVLIMEIGLVYYALRLASVWTALVGYGLYGILIVFQLLGIYLALTASPPREPQSLA